MSEDRDDYCVLKLIQGTQFKNPRFAEKEVSPFILRLQPKILAYENMGIYIRNGHLAALHEYKYAGQDKSLTSKYILNPFWTKFVVLFPATVAPNLITLTGFSFVVFNFVTLLIYTPTLVEPCPSWVYMSWGVGLFLYQTFDAVDGKQARKLGLSGPLGECFDHGVDALNTTVLPSDAGYADE